jgi:hypothetical protein
MKDSLKDFVNQSRKSFDDKQPREEAWRKVESNLPRKSVSMWNSVAIWRAAAILLLGVCSYLALAPREGKENKAETANELKGQFNDLEVFYTNQIVEKKELVSNFQIETGYTEDEITQNLQKLDAMYQVLKEQMELKPSKDISDALVLNLLVRIDLLNQQLNKLDRRNGENDVSVNS